MCAPCGAQLVAPNGFLCLSFTKIPSESAHLCFEAWRFSLAVVLFLQTSPRAKVSSVWHRPQNQETR